MTGAQPIYAMIKPPEDVADEIDRQRRALGIESNYGCERFHTTLLPLCDGRDVPDALLERLCEVFAALGAEPFEIRFDRLNRNALVGKAMRAPRAFQRQLVRRLIASGLPVPAYLFRPHLSVAYGAAPERTIPIPPIGWPVEEFLLIKSIHGEGRHELLGRWPLVARQHEFDF